ncbi:hypothetical protein ACFXKG_33950 [Streptomyces sp. NPDC059255]|uniref:hypothetical protein n=1 Tax=Streptomyces sp. NPDC059255 TaxID=3346793 RepID=UPI0036755A1F
MPPASPTPPAPVTAAAHTATTVERGSFCLARCTCGWSGPARRARDRARADADNHADNHADSHSDDHAGTAPR